MRFISEIQNGFNICKPINVICYFNKMKDKNNIISMDAETAFDKIQYPFLVKKIQQIGIDRKYHSKIK